MPDVSEVPMLRTSERTTFKECQQKWWWAYRQGLKSKSTSDPLWFGTGIHLALAAWYCGPGATRGPHPAETWKKYAEDSIRTAKTELAAEEEFVNRWVDLGELGVSMLEGYVGLYGRDERIHVLGPEQTFSLEVPWPDDIDSLGAILDISRPILITYKGTFDLPFRDLDTGKIKIQETKTAKSISTKHLTLDDQAGAYWAVSQRVLRTAGIIKPNDIVAGVEYNFLRKAMPDTRPRDSGGYACNKPVKDDYIQVILNAQSSGMSFGGANRSEPALRKMKISELEELVSETGIIVLGERSKIQPPPNFVRETIWRTSPERRTQLLRIREEAVQMEFFRQGILPPTKRPTIDCSWRCEFFGMCELDEQGVDISEFMERQYLVMDPYADHRKGTE